MHEVDPISQTKFPVPWPGQVGWYNNVLVEGPTYLPTLGFDPGNVSDVINDCAWGSYLLSDAVPQTDTFASMMHGFADTALTGSEAAMTMPAWTAWSPVPPSGPLRAGIEQRRIAWVERAKGAPQYTPEVIGAALRLIPTGTPFNPAGYQGQIVSAVLAGHEQVKFVVRLAKGNIDGGNLYLQRNGDTQPNLVRFFSMRTFTDTTPLKVAGAPEVRIYTYWPVINDVQIGECSQAVQVTVS